MYDITSSIILAIVQGIAEWLPISSSGHLVLFQELFGIKGDFFLDIALHFGTLMAVFVYFGKDITDIAEHLLKLDFKSKEGRLALLVLVASIPAGILGFTLLPIFEEAFQSLSIVALGFAITGIFMFISSLDFPTKKSSQISYTQALIIGIAQAVAIFPGISRSGSTIGSGLLVGLDKESALKFSFLMSIPAIIGANIVAVGNNPLPPQLLIATFISFLVGLATIHFLFKVVLTSKKNLRYFGAYTLLLSLAIFTYLLLQ